MALTKIKTDGVTDDAITSGKIPANAVGSSELADDAVDTNAIQDDAVTADKLANSINTEIAANTAKTSNATHTGDVTGSTSLTIADDAVTTAKIADDAVTSAKIASNSVTNDSINNDSIHGDKLTSATISTAKLADDAVTLAKFQDLPVNTLLGRVSSGSGTLEELTAANVRSIINVADGATAGGGITMTDSWQITADFTGDATPISSNWKRADQTLAGNLGTGLSESSGVFTFPSTGYYYIIWTHSNRNTGTSTYQYMQLQITGNNSSYSDWGFTAGFHRTHTGAWHWTKNVEAGILDITDTTNQKIRFRVDNESGSTVTMGDTAAKRTGFEIIRLGDT